MPVGMVGTHYEGGGTPGTMRLTEESFLLVAEGQKVQITVVFIDHLFKKNGSRRLKADDGDRLFSPCECYIKKPPFFGVRKLFRIRHGKGQQRIVHHFTREAVTAAFKSRNDDVIVFKPFGGVNRGEDNGDVFSSNMR